jgi:hypothetical protein
MMARTLRKTAYMATVGAAFVGFLMLSVSRSYLVMDASRKPYGIAYASVTG